MSKKWRNVKIGDICDVSSSKRVMAKDYTSTGIPFYRSKEIIELQNGNQITNPLYISKEQFNSIIKKFGGVSEGDILLTSVGTIGVPYIVKSEDEFYFKDGNLTWFKNYKEDINNFYLYHWLKSNFAKKQIDGALIGTTQKALTIDSIKNLHITLPPLEEQEKIANLLSALDNKIELNNQMNKDLEELAQTLYTKWFINFDFSNEEGKPYKSSGGEMIDSEFGEIPAGWRIGKLGDLINKNKEKIKNKKDWENEKLIDLSNMPSYTMCLNESDLGKKLNSNIYKLNKYDILFGSIRPYLGKAGFAPFDGVVAGTIHSFIPKEKDFYSYVLCMTTRKLFFEYAIARSKGTKMPVVDYESICEYTCLIPSNEVIEQFNMIVFSYIKQISKNIEENQQLKEIRDLLLPYLMSGKIDLGE